MLTGESDGDGGGKTECLKDYEFVVESDDDADGVCLHQRLFRERGSGKIKID